MRKRGYSWSKEQELNIEEVGTVPVIRIPNIGDTLSLEKLLYLRDVPDEALKESAVTKDWILFVASNGNPERIGDSALIREDRDMVFASFLLAIKPKDIDILLPDYLALWLRLHNVHQTFSKTSQQTTGLANFSWSAVKNLPIRFPSEITEQQSIVSLVDLVSESIAKAKAEIESASRLKRALMQQLFTRGIPGKHKEFKQTKIGEIPAAWKVLRIRNVLDSLPFNGVSPQSRDEPPGTPILNVSCIDDGICDPSLVTYVDVDEETFDECRARKGDFFVLRGNGNRDYVGVGGLLRVEPDPPCIFSDKLIRLRFNPDLVAENFIPWLWQSKTFLHRLQSKAESGSGLWMMSKRDIKREWFAYPEPDEQAEIVRVLEGTRTLITSQEQRLKTLGRLKKSLLQNLLTGKVRLNVKATS